MACHRERYPPESIHDAIRESDPTPQDCRRCEDPAAVSLRHYPVSRSAQAGSSNRSVPPTRPMPRVAIVTLGGMQPIGFGCVGPTDSPRTLAHQHGNTTSRRTNGDTTRAHQHPVQPWQSPRSQVQPACRSRKQRILHRDEILMGVEHDVAHASTTKPTAPAE